MQPTVHGPLEIFDVNEGAISLKLKNGILSFVTVTKFSTSQSKNNVIIKLVYEHSVYSLLKTTDAF
jgi:hypothetical protein